jgi:hypothetical protein
MLAATECEHPWRLIFGVLKCMSDAVIAGSCHMTSINEESGVAKAAKAVISTLSTTAKPNSTTWAPLHHAYRIAVLRLSNKALSTEARKNPELRSPV